MSERASKEHVLLWNTSTRHQLEYPASWGLSRSRLDLLSIGNAAGSRPPGSSAALLPPVSRRYLPGQGSGGGGENRIAFPLASGADGTFPGRSYWECRFLIGREATTCSGVAACDWTVVACVCVRVCVAPPT